VRILKTVDLNGKRLEWAFAGWSEGVDLPVDGAEQRSQENEDARSPSALVQSPSKPTPLGLTTFNRNKVRIDPQLFGISNHGRDNVSQATTAVASPSSQDSNPQLPLSTLTLRPTKRMTWHHYIDSRHRIDSPSIPTDTGVIYPLNDTKTLETGSAISFPGFPEGQHTNYEELWDDVEIYAINDGRPKRKVCVVLRTEDVTPYGDPVRGIVIRLGQFVQGILRKKDSVTVERWEFIKGENRAEGTWKRTFRIGSEGLPCAAAQRERDLEQGMKLDMLGYEWEVEELVEWV